MGVSDPTARTITQRKIKHQASPPLPSVNDYDVLVQNMSGTPTSCVAAKPRKKLTNSRSIMKRRLGQTSVRLGESDSIKPPPSNGGIKIANKRLYKSASFIKPVRVGVRARNDASTGCFVEATCSSKFRSTAFPSDGDESLQHFEMETTSTCVGSSSKKVCHYTYCSLHGAGRPQLKRVVSIRRPAPSRKTYNSKPKVHLQNKPSKVARDDDEHMLSKSTTASAVTNQNIHQMENTTQGNTMSHNQQLSEAAEVTKDEKPREENEKTTRVWRLIYHSMLSAKYRSELYPQVNADSITPAPVHENCSQVKSEDTPAVMPTFESSHCDAVKLVEEAIDELFLPEVDEQVSNNQTSGASERDVHEIKLADSSSTINRWTIDSAKEVKPFSRVGSESMSKNWSKLKQMVLLKRFVKALDKLSDIKFKEPKFLNVEDDPEMEKVRLRRQTTEEKRLADEWMLDYALRQAVAKLTPARRKKVELLIEAFESVIPLSENGTPQNLHKSLSSHVSSFGHLYTEETEPSAVPFKEVDRDCVSITIDTEQTSEKPSLVSSKCNFELVGGAGSVLSQDQPPLPAVHSPKHKLSEVASSVLGKFVSDTQASHKLERNWLNQSSTVTGLISHYHNGIIKHTEAKSIPTPDHSIDSRHDDTETAKVTKIASALNHETVQEDPLRSNSAKQRDIDIQLDNQKYFKMWGMIYNHVVSGTAAKIGSDLRITESVNGGTAMDSKLDAVKLVEVALDEMLNPEYQDQSSDEQSVISDQDDLERAESMDSGISTPKDSISFYFKDLHRMKANTSGEADGKGCAATQTHEPKTADQTISKINRLRSNRWSNLKKFILLKRFIRALDKLKKFNPREPNYLSLEPDQEPEKVSLKHQTSADRLSAEQWMIDNAIQQVVARLTPARKRRVELLVEAFETVETVLPSPSTRIPLKHSWPSAPRTKHF